MQARWPRTPGNSLGGRILVRTDLAQIWTLCRILIRTDRAADRPWAGYYVRTYAPIGMEVGYVVLTCRLSRLQLNSGSATSAYRQKPPTTEPGEPTARDALPNPTHAHRRDPWWRCCTARFLQRGLQPLLVCRVSFSLIVRPHCALQCALASLKRAGDSRACGPFSLVVHTRSPIMCAYSYDAGEEGLQAPTMCRMMRMSKCRRVCTYTLRSIQQNTFETNRLVGWIIRGLYKNKE